MTQNIFVEPGSLLESIGKWKKALSSSVTGPLFVSGEVIAIVDTWSQHKDSAGGLTSNAFCKKHLGYPAVFFYNRARALDFIGRSLGARCHHDLAVWMSTAVPQEKLDHVKMTLLRETKARGENPVSEDVGKRICLEAMGVSPPKRQKTDACKRCERLMCILEKHGIAE